MDPNGSKGTAMSEEEFHRMKEFDNEHVARPSFLKSSVVPRLTETH